MILTDWYSSQIIRWKIVDLEKKKKRVVTLTQNDCMSVQSNPSSWSLPHAQVVNSHHIWSVAYVRGKRGVHFSTKVFVFHCIISHAVCSLQGMTSPLLLIWAWGRLPVTSSCKTERSSLTVPYTEYETHSQQFKVSGAFHARSPSCCGEVSANARREKNE